MGIRILLTSTLCVLLGAGEAVVRIGSAGSRPDPSRFDPRFPEMAEWAAAGVTGGIPRVERRVGSAGPEDDLAGAIDAADVAADRPGVLVLRPGTYRFDGVIRLKPGLVLRGLERRGVVLASTLDESVSAHGVGEKHAVEMATASGLEDLTVCNEVVRAIPEEDYQGAYDNPGAPMSGLVRFGGKVRDAWVQRCDLTHAGSNPVSMAGAHITLRDCLIDKAYNKGGKGHGYLELGHARHVLFYNCDIRDIRHVSIMWKSRYVVIYGCRLNVDINFHDGLPTRCLVERTTIRRRGGHHWSPICYGWPPWQDVGPGPRNFLWHNDFDGSGAGDGRVWVLRDTTGGYDALETKRPMEIDFGAPPAHGTLYAVTGKDVPYSEVLKARYWEELNRSVAAERYAVAIDRAENVRLLFPADSEEFARAEEVLATCERLAREAWTDLRERPRPTTIREFFAAWGGTAVAADAREEAAGFAADAFESIGGAEASAYRLKEYVEGWYGVVEIPEALAAFSALAEQNYRNNRRSLRSVRNLQRFIQRWPHTDAAATAEARLVEKLRAVLDDYVAKRDSLSRRQRERIADQFADTPLADEAERRLLGE